MRALLLTGAVGSGKTTVLREIGAVLEERGDSYALVDLDWLCWISAAISPREALAANLRAVCATYAAAGVDRIVLARGEVDVVRSVLDVFAVRLDVPRAELERRLRARDHGAELVEHLALLDAPAEPADAVVSGEGSPREVARAVLTVAGWRTPGDALTS
jgi:hypothetical protein